MITSDPLPKEKLWIRHFLLFHAKGPKLGRGIGGDLSFQDHNEWVDMEVVYHFLE